jgi:ADP-heptose:LPS heptosyltransferase
VSRRRTLVVRLDSMGDVLISGPAIRAVAAGSAQTTLLVGPFGVAAAHLLPGVDNVVVWDCPWIAARPPAVEADALRALIDRVRTTDANEAVVLTSFHQSALPTALLLRAAGIRRITAVSEDYPGSLLDVRVPPPPEGPEPERMLSVARAAGFELPPGDDGRLRVKTVPELLEPIPATPFLVVHPGTSAPARAYPLDSWREVVARLTARGWTVLVTGSKDETELTTALAAAARSPGTVRDMGGTLELSELAAVLQRSAALIVANTGPAHLAAAVGTPVVSLFAPVVSASHWAPYGVESVVLGDQYAACRDTRARKCPVLGHLCLSTVTADDVVAAAEQLAARRQQ